MKHTIFVLPIYSDDEQQKPCNLRKFGWGSKTTLITPSCYFSCLSGAVTPGQIDAQPPFSNSTCILLMVIYHINLKESHTSNISY